MLLYCNAPRPMRQVSSSYSLLLPCHPLVCCILPCHHVHCIILFSKPASVRVPPVPSVVRSEPRHTCTRPWHVRNSSRNGMRVDVWSCYSVGRPPAKFHRNWSSFDAPTFNYRDSIAGLTSEVFGLRKQSPGLPLFSSLSSRPSAQATYRQVQPNLSRRPSAHPSRVRKLSRTRPEQSSPSCPDHPQTPTKRLHFSLWAT